LLDGTSLHVIVVRQNTVQLIVDMTAGMFLYTSDNPRE
jgi:hypothetical protein